MGNPGSATGQAYNPRNNLLYWRIQEGWRPEKIVKSMMLDSPRMGTLDPPMFFYIFEICVALLIAVTLFPSQVFFKILLDTYTHTHFHFWGD